MNPWRKTWDLQECLNKYKGHIICRPKHYIKLRNLYPKRTIHVDFHISSDYFYYVNRKGQFRAVFIK